jgi:hypothetical protein
VRCALLILFDSCQFAASDVTVPLICLIDRLIRQQQIEDHTFASVVGPDRTAPEQVVSLPILILAPADGRNQMAELLVRAEVANDPARCPKVDWL